MRYFPFFFDMKDKHVLVVGGGLPASSKVRLLTKSDACITVVARQLNDDLSLLHGQGKIIWLCRDFQETDLDGKHIIYCATGDLNEDKRLSDLARAKGVITAAVDQAEASDIITPALVDRDPVVVAIGSEGTSPVLARTIKAQVETILPDHVGRFARFAGRQRNWMEEVLPTSRARRLFWRSFITAHNPLKAFLKSDKELKQAADKLVATYDQKSEGKLIFVGAGPGDPELLTLKAVNALREADSVYYDALLDKRVLEYARREAKLICVGKRAGAHSWKQDDINEAITSEALKGHMVVRLKGGDPNLFGRLGEELEAAQNADIEVEIVPGITAASAAASALKTPLTNRENAQGIIYLTARDAQGFCEHDWQALVRLSMPKIFYMGKSAARFIQGRLLMNNMAPTTPVTIVANAAKHGQQRIATDLGEMANAVERTQEGTAVLILIGLRGAQVDEALRSKAIKIIKSETSQFMGADL